MEKDRETYRWAGIILRWGMYLSFAMMLTGQVWALIASANSQTLLRREAVPLDRLVAELVAGDPLALVSLGVVLLLMTPGITLLSTAFTYAMARKWRLVGIATLVVLILLLSLAISLKWIKLL
jgi:uncharacterized membrane protein